MSQNNDHIQNTFQFSNKPEDELTSILTLDEICEVAARTSYHLNQCHEQDFKLLLSDLEEKQSKTMREKVLIWVKWVLKKC